MRYKVVVAYDGSNFNGYQRQENLRTVQGEIEKSLHLVCKEDVTVHASGRTDACVHAKYQVIHFDTNLNISVSDMKNALNSTLPEDIYARLVNRVNEDFHARYSAKNKQYQYIINIGEYNPLLRNYVYQYNRELDVRKMEEALKLVVGTHDFTGFTMKDDNGKSKVRTIDFAELDFKNDVITITISGDGFLRYMVRSIVGTLVEIGREKFEIDCINEILTSRNRDLAGPTISGVGLYLTKVKY